MLKHAAMPNSRRRKQNAKREEFLGLVVRKMIKKLEREDDLARLHATNRLIPPGGLRRHAVKRLFWGWVKKLRGEGRVVTKKLAALACGKLRDYFGLPHLDGEMATKESDRFHRLLKLARKRGLGKASAMDSLETQPMHQEEGRFLV